MADMCVHCELDTAGQHEDSCPLNNVNGSRASIDEPIYPANKPRRHIVRIQVIQPER